MATINKLKGKGTPPSRNQTKDNLSHPTSDGNAPTKQVTKPLQFKVPESVYNEFCELAGKTIGLMGYGALAKGVEKLALAFDMKIMIAARAGSETAPEGRVLIEDLLPQVDVLSVHCPLTPTTHKLINRAFLEQMKPSALLVNSARGAVVDNADLAQALRDGVIAGAGIDVLEVEPPPANHPLLAAEIPNLSLAITN